MDESRHELRLKARLDAVVRGALAFVEFEFDGPATAYIGSPPNCAVYVTLCSHGIKLERDSAPTFDTAQEAIELYGEQLREMVKTYGGKMLAWRARPELVDVASRFRVYSRLAFI